MNRHRPIISAVLLAAMLPVSTAFAEGKLIVEFTGMASDAGVIVCSLVDSHEQFLSSGQQPLRDASLVITDARASWHIDGLAFGSYAISAYHDANSNAELDTGLFGIPNEDYGFSNNARGTFGPPDFTDAKFEFNQSGQTLTIRID